MNIMTFHNETQCETLERGDVGLRVAGGQFGCSRVQWFVPLSRRMCSRRRQSRMSLLKGFARRSGVSLLKGFARRNGVSLLKGFARREARSVQRVGEK